MNEQVINRIIALIMFLGAGVAATVKAQVLSHTFDGVANDVGPAFQQVGNGLGSGSASPTTGSVSSGSASNGTWGLNNSSLLDLSSDGASGITIEWVIDGFTGSTGNINSNGWFFGVVSGSSAAGTAGGSLFNNDPDAIGVTLYSPKFGNMQLTQFAGSTPTTTALGSAVPNLSSLQDGFTISLTINSDNSWSASSTGLSTEISSAGTLSGSSTLYADVVGGLGAYTSIQGQNLSYTVESVSISLFNTPDTDGDDMPDFWEDLHSLNKNDPADASVDGDAVGGADGLTNLQEYLEGTDPQDSDSDDDGLKDGEEVNGTLNPWTNGVLATPPGERTDPTEADSDGDGENDGDEITNGTNPNRPPPNTGPRFPFVDTDGDSYRDEAETAFGSDPDNPDDCPDHTPGPAKPNIVIIYADDMGLGDMSAYGALFGTPSPATTPRMDSLATEGVLFTQGHSSNAVCTPSRYSLLTGKYNWREFDSITGHYGGLIGGDEVPRLSDVTIAEFLKTQGYDTAAFGKWHLGGAFYSPTGTRITSNPTDPNAVDWDRPVELHAVAHGFDHFRGLAASINFGPYVYLHDDRVQVWDPTLNDGYGSDITAAGMGGFRNATSRDAFRWLTTGDLNSSVVGAKDSRASLGDPTYRQVDADPVLIKDFENYIDDRVEAADTDPFFTYVSLYSPHKPWALTSPFIGADSAAGFHYADWMREIDHRIGRVIDAIDDNGLRDNTIIFLTSDNGPENTAMSQSLSFGKDPNGPLRGNKRDVWEGGTRVPFVVRWPGQAAPGMKVNDLVWQGDFFATVAAFLQTDLPDTTAPDGESFLNIIRGQQKPDPQREGIVVSSIAGQLGLKTTDGWKLIDSTGGGNNTSWDSKNNPLSGLNGIDQGTPKQLFELSVDLGEDFNLISTLTGEAEIRRELISLTGRDLLDSLDQMRANTTASLFPRVPDNDGDEMPNSFENTYGLDLDSPKDAVLSLDGDPSSNFDEYIAGTDPSDGSDFFHVVNLADGSSEFSVVWNSVAGRSYQVFWSIGLNESWTLYSSHTGTGSEMSVPIDKSAIDAVDEVSGNLTKLFVRVVVSNP